MEETSKVPYGFVYETTNNITGMKYIGKCIYGRQNNWKSYLGSGTYLKRAINKYGKQNFSRIILEDAYSDEELNCLEEKYIKELNAVEDTSYYNLKYTSIGGDITTFNPRREEIIEMRRQQMTGEGNHQYGKPKTDKMIESVKKANSKKIEIDGVVYGSSTEAAKSLKLPNSTICYRLDSENYSNYKRLTKKKEGIIHTRYYPIEIDGVQYKNMTEAAKALDINPNTLKAKISRGEIKNYKKLY